MQTKLNICAKPNLAKRTHQEQQKNPSRTRAPRRGTSREPVEEPVKEPVKEPVGEPVEEPVK